MPTEAELDHIVSSRQVLSAYEQMGLPGGRIEDVLRQLGQEIAWLHGYVERYPETSDSITALIGRWTAMRDRVKASGN